MSQETIKIEIKKGGNPFGAHRVIEPKGSLPQPALKLDNNMDYMYDNEIMVEVETLNIDSASFTQLKQEAKNDEEKIKKRIMEIVNERGKMQNPVTGSGGMFRGKIFKIGPAIKNKVKVKEGDKIASLVSLSLTPLKIEKIIGFKKGTEQVNVVAKAIIFESGIYAKLPSDMPETLALAVLDVAGAPAQTERLVKKGNIVAIIGAAGKSGILCSYIAKKKVGKTGKVIGITSSDKGMEKMKEMGFCDVCLKVSATEPLSLYESVYKVTGGKLADVVINCVNIPNTEMGSILITKDGGTLYFFSMATSFTKAALGAEGIGKDINMIIGNGYVKNHDELTLDILRENKKIREEYGKNYA
ncbi:MAG: zinc-binding dehydrogenase [Elusimicrobiota bacterium]